MPGSGGADRLPRPPRPATWENAGFARGRAARADFWLDTLHINQPNQSPNPSRVSVAPMMDRCE